MKAAVDAAHIAVAAVHRMDILRGVFPATLFRRGYLPAGICG